MSDEFIAVGRIVGLPDGRVVSPPPIKDADTYEVQIQGSSVLLKRK
jgi:hypothetical protein